MLIKTAHVFVNLSYLINLLKVIFNRPYTIQSRKVNLDLYIIKFGVTPQKSHSGEKAVFVTKKLTFIS